MAGLLFLPFDNVKTILQKMKACPKGIFPYKGLMDCLLNTSKNEGLSILWVGISTYYFRVAPQDIVALVCNDFPRGYLTKSNDEYYLIFNHYLIFYKYLLIF